MEPTQEQLRNREIAAGNIASGVPQNQGIITSDNLTPEPSIDFQEPVGTPIPDVSKIELTAPEERAQETTEEIITGQERLRGESAFRAGLEEEQGIPELTSTFRDLQSRLRGIQAEAQAIPLQIQEESAGRGRTRGGVAPLEAGRLRKNAIQALTVSSLLEATRGNLATAQDLVDRAVAQKYDPIREEIAVNKANLDLILQSPEFSVADKRRAQEQKQQQEERERAIEEQATQEKAIKEIGIDAASRGADAVTLRRIENAASVVEAQRIANEFKSTLPPTEEERREELENKLLEERIATERIQQRKLEHSIATALEESQPESKNEEVEKALSVRDIANEMLNHEGLKAATGPIGAFLPSLSTLTGTTIDFGAAFDQLKAALTIDRLKLMSGVLSDTDIRILENAGTRLRRNMNADDFKRELNKIISTVERTINKEGVTDEQAKFYFGIDQDDINEVNDIFGVENTTSTPSTQQNFNPAEFF